MSVAVEKKSSYFGNGPPMKLSSSETSFVPINIRQKCVQHLKKKRKNKKHTKIKQKNFSASVVKKDNKMDTLKIERRANTFDSIKTTSSSTKLPSLTSPTVGSSPRLVTPTRKIPPLPPSAQPVTASECGRKLPLLAAIKPENEKSEKERFMRANYNYNPYFLYRFPADPEVLQKLGVPSDRFMHQAISIMEIALQKYGTYEEFEVQSGGQVLSRAQIFTSIRRYLKRENLENEVQINLSEDLLSRGSMTRVKGRPTLNVRVVNLRELWLDGLLRHEIGTHYLRSCNNKYQPWYNYKNRKALDMGPMNPTEEGLASLHSVLFRKDPSLWRAAVLYYTAYKATYLSLKDLFKDLGRFLRDQNVRWDYCIRAKRGQVDTSEPGAFCKDQVYLDGALQILKKRRYLDFHMLVRLGKVAHEDVERLRDYADLECTRVPFFMEDIKQYRQHLDRIAEANELTDEVLANL